MYIYICVLIGALVIFQENCYYRVFICNCWIVVVVEPCCLDEGRSLYSVEYSVATTRIRIIFDICVCLFVVTFIPPRLLHNLFILELD